MEHFEVTNVMKKCKPTITIVDLMVPICYCWYCHYIGFYICRDTPTSSGPNSFGKGRFGFLNRNALLERELEAYGETVSDNNNDPTIWWKKGLPYPISIYTQHRTDYICYEINKILVALTLYKNWLGSFPNKRFILSHLNLFDFIVH